MASNNNSEETQHYSNELKVQFSLKWKISLVFSIVFSVIFLLTLEGIINPSYQRSRPANKN